jgi:mannosyltransferase OCH1-like enzyme
MSNIPKVIHISWKTEEIFNSNLWLVNNGLKNLVSMNPDWRVEFSDDLSVDVYLRENLSADDYLLIKNCGIVEKIDLWRLFKLYNEGGLYIDLDRMYNVPLADILDDETKLVLPINNNFDFSHDLMLSAPYNPIYKEAINLYLERRRNGHTNIYFLGPQTYTHSITKVLTGNIIDVNPGKDVFDKLREMISEYSFIKVYNENLPYDTLVFKKPDDFEDIDHEVEKRKLYAEFNMKHWTGEW